MGITAPQYFGGIPQTTINANRSAQAGEVTTQAPAINKKLKTLPAYQAYMQTLNSGGSAYERQQAAAALAKQAAPLNIPDDLIIDPTTGLARQKNFNEAHSNWSALLYSGAAIGAGLGAGAALGAVGAAGAGAGGAASGAGASVAGGAGYVGADVAGTAAASLGPAAAGGGMSYLSWIGPAVNAATSIYGANEQAGTAADNAALQAQSLKYAADLQAKAAADALAYTKQQGAQTQSNFDTSQQGNYNQWAAGQRRLSTLGEAMGLGPREIPAYVPPKDVLDTGAPTQAAAPGTLGSMATTPQGQAASGNPNDPAYITQQLQDVYKQLGVAPTGPGSGPTDIAYMTDAVLKNGGWNAAAPGYWPQRIAQELQKAAGGAAPAPINPAPTSTPMGTLGAPLQVAPPVTGVLQMPQPGTLGYMAGYR
jgi:hypothetical protein